VKKQIQNFANAADLSPITPKGQVVYSSIKVEALHDDGAGTHRIVTYTPERSDAIRVLSFLNNINGISWTPELKQIERELRSALHDLMDMS